MQYPPHRLADELLRITHDRNRLAAILLRAVRLLPPGELRREAEQLLEECGYPRNSAAATSLLRSLKD